MINVFYCSILLNLAECEDVTCLEKWGPSPGEIPGGD